jgi:cytochrome c
VIVLARARGGEAERAVQSCRRCHGLDLNGTVAGPSLRGLFDRNIATAPGFSYSLALRRLGGRWTDKGLDSFLRDPETFAPGSSMAFSIPDSLVRRAVIEYLKKGGSGSVGR